MQLNRFVIALPLVTVAWAGEASAPPSIVSISKEAGVEATWEDKSDRVNVGGHVGPWTLMATIASPQGAVAVFESLGLQDGRITFVRKGGVVADLPKSLEPTFAADPAKLYLGHSLSEVLDSPRDLLGSEILARPTDPNYAEVESCFPPIRLMRTAFTFVGTRRNADKVGFQYGGETSHFDPAAYVPEIRRIRKEGKVWQGLVGGWLPVLRFVYPEAEGTWSEMVAFAPPRMENGNAWIQPVWYRIYRIEGNELKWVRYFDSYHPFPPRMESSAEAFYRDLLATRAHWRQELQPAMRIELPDGKLADMALHSLVRDMITRVGAQPKYGVFDKNYGGSEHEGFPDTFNADTASMNDWGLLGLAAQYIDNYFGKYVRDDGSILYRGPETGQYGRMLTVAAQYGRYSGDFQTLLRNRSRIDGVAKLLLSMRKKALGLPPDNPAHGIPAGWSEADACLDPEPQRYMQPYFSNAAEMARGFREMGEVWQLAARANKDQELEKWGAQMKETANAVEKDLQAGIGKSLRHDLQPPFLPSIAGVSEPFDIAVARDPLDPQFRSYRAFMEMLHSGLLTKDQVKTVVDYRAAHHDVILGVPTAYGYSTHELVGFLTYGHAYGLLQHDMVREYLLALYSIMAHQYTRGTWTAPETRNIDPEKPAAPYCTPAQLVVPMMVRWMLVFEDPSSDTLWLAKGTPREWLGNGKHISVQAAPTRWGKVGFAIRSHLAQNRVETELTLPASGVAAPIKLRLRAPENYTIKSVRMSGRAWKDFDPKEETVTLPASTAGKVILEVSY